MGNKLSELRSFFRRIRTDPRIRNLLIQQIQAYPDLCHGIIYSYSNRFSEKTRLYFCSEKQKIYSREFSRSRAFWPMPVVESLFLPEFKPQKFCKNCDFQIISFIANGAFGKVFKVLDRKSNKFYAMKILQKSRIVDENAVVQVKDEIRIQSICGHHQFLVNCLFSWQTHSEIFFVSEHKSGGELLGLIEKFAPLPENIVRIFIAEIALAIDFLHNAGIIHRDIKPENILLDENYHLSLTDFGLSKWLSIGSRTSTICGTPQYMAPEIKAMESYTHAVDWWSLGIVTCRLLTNEYPKIEASKTILPKDNDLSIPSKDLLLRLMTVDPLRRLRNLYTLKTVAFFMDFNFKNISDRKVNPKELLFSHYQIEEYETSSVFEDFDSTESYSEAFYGTLV